MELTIQQYNLAIDKCKDIFKKKTTDYGTAWRILRTSSLTDQIFIKANRIRTIQQTGESKINEGVEEEFVGIINYCVMALIQLELKDDSRLEIDAQEAIQLYLDFVNKAKDLMVQKNHDYGEAWRDMRVSSLTDLILMKILRVKQIENNSGKTLISEGIDANYYDMLNYAVFALIHLDESS
ncbi:MAG: hypothetical protein CMD01_01890 [Flavobacteriales bacterium]|nr:hypothetical protein [Flavobacteriales bacterium]MBG15323.1 hypothetical protein [Crocinitomicaceae bacterium]